MSALPDDVWRRILKIGTSTPNLLNFKDLCRLSIASRSFNRLSIEEDLWSDLLTSDFPHFESSILSSSSNYTSSQNPTSKAPSKALYRNRYERMRFQLISAQRRLVLRIQSRIAELTKQLEDLKVKSAEEIEKLEAAVAELSNLSRIRQASVALNIWQPEVVKGKHKQLVEQGVVSMDSRVHAIEMEIRLCRKQLEGFDRTSKYVQKRLNYANLDLESAQYHPFVTESGIDNSSLKRTRKRNRK